MQWLQTKDHDAQFSDAKVSDLTEKKNLHSFDVHLAHGEVKLNF